MSRIRSIHPGIWTDEAFMSLSAHARLLLMGIWTEAFDDGVFEWKPLTLKARIFPVDAVDVSDLLGELVSANLISRAERHPKMPGLIRNFQKFQRPKKPNSSGMLPDEWREYVGGKPDDAEPVPDQFPTGTEKSPQMEDGGWKGTTPSGVVAAPRDGLDEIQSRLLEAVGENGIQPHGALNLSPILGLLAAGVDLETDIIPTIRARAQRLRRPAGSWAYFVEPIRDAHAQRLEAGKGITVPKLESDALWLKRLALARNDRSWASSEWGPPPGSERCRVPKHLLQPGDGSGWKSQSAAA